MAPATDGAPPGRRPEPASRAREQPGQPDGWTPAEVNVTCKLLSWRRQFVVTADRKVDTSSERGHLVVTKYLQCVDAACRALNVRPASRGYRDSFTPKYRSLWPGRSRQLQVCVVEASNQQVIYMSGHVFEFGPTAEHLAAHMRHEWAELGRLLKRLHEEQVAGRLWAANFRDELRRALGALDKAWADFEDAYVKEAMAIEEQALALLAEACGCEEALSAELWSCAGDGRACERQLGELVRLLHLLSARTCADGGRPADWRLDARALLEAKSILAIARQQVTTEGRHAPDPARVVAARAIGAFEAVRNYLSCARLFWGHVDGDLANNADLVALLTRWQEEVSAAARFLASSDLRCALRGVAACACAAQTVAPQLGAMVASLDADLFLVLPRIAWLGFLSAPDRNGPLIEHVLPELFPQPGRRGPELRAFAEAYSRAIEQIAGEAADDGADAEQLASVGAARGLQLADQGACRRVLDVLVQRAVLGRDSQPGGLPGGPSAPVETFLQSLEGWSMRLQRVRPDVWNALAAILVQCLSGDASVESAGIDESAGIGAFFRSVD